MPSLWLTVLALAVVLTPQAHTSPTPASPVYSEPRPARSSRFSHVPLHPRPPYYEPSQEEARALEQVLANISRAEALNAGSNPVTAQTWSSKRSTFHPINPPSIPIAVRSPYLNAWVPSGSLLSVSPPNTVGNGGYLASQAPAFWTSSYGASGEFRMGWNGLVRVDNMTYQFMGNACGRTIAACRDARQVSMTYTATRTIFEFEADNVWFNVTFLTPITPHDYLRQSLPLSYMHIELDHKSRKRRSVQVYTDIDERWVTGHDYDWENHPFTMKYSENSKGASIYQIARQQPRTYQEYRQRAEWGTTVYAALNTTALTSRNNNNVVAQHQFVEHGALTHDHGSVGGPDNAFAFAVDFNKKSSREEAVFAIGHLREPYVNYIRAMPGKDGQTSYQEHRYGYWQTKYPRFVDAVSFFLSDFQDALAGAKKFDAKVDKDSRDVVGGGEVGKQYAAITTLSLRQALATIEITVPYDQRTGKYDADDTLVFLKEISSNGDMQTVDVFFPLFPLLTYLNPDLLMRLMKPIFDYNESGLYPNKWCSHDLGVYPNAFGHNAGDDEPMQVEESGDMIVLAAHWAQVTGGAKARRFLKKHYRILQQWAEFLVTDSLVPATQLSTDDFAGVLANQTNLAIKGVEGIAAMGVIADILNHTSAARKYRKTARAYIAAWQNLSIDAHSTHVKLAYQTDRSWGTLYNLFADRLLDLRLVPRSVYELQDRWYMKKALPWGVPLDSRHNWTKSDWQMFASATSASTKTRDMFIDRLYRFVSNGRTDSPFSDLYEASTGDTPKEPADPRIHFLARPVVGGHFMHLALALADKANGISERTPYVYGDEAEALGGQHHHRAVRRAMRLWKLAKRGRWAAWLALGESEADRRKEHDWELEMDDDERGHHGGQHHAEQPNLDHGGEVQVELPRADRIAAAWTMFVLHLRDALRGMLRLLLGVV